MSVKQCIAGFVLAFGISAGAAQWAYTTGYERGYRLGGSEEHARASGDAYFVWDGRLPHDDHEPPKGFTYVRCSDEGPLVPYQEAIAR